jgi:hypothetical protein
MGNAIAREIGTNCATTGISGVVESMLFGYKWGESFYRQPVNSCASSAMMGERMITIQCELDPNLS